MPYYHYICTNCQQRVRLFFSYADYGQKEPICPHCQHTTLKRQIGRIALAKSEEARMDAVMDESSLAGLDESDPRSLGQFMRKMSHEVGEDMGEEFNEVVDRLESGQSPESIEQSMPQLTDKGEGLPP